MAIWCNIVASGARISAVDAAAGASGLSLFVYFCFQLYAAVAVVRLPVALLTLQTPGVEVSFCFLRCFCFAVDADRKSGGNRSRRLLFELNGLVFGCFATNFAETLRFGWFPPCPFIVRADESASPVINC